MIQRLNEKQPLVIEDHHAGSNARFREVLPAVADYIDQHYGPAKAFGPLALREPYTAGRSTTNR